MELVRQIVVLTHFIGFAALLGGLLVQVRGSGKRVLPVMRDGIVLAFVAGLALVGIAEAGDHPVNHAKIAVKFTVALVLLILIVAKSRRERIPAGLFYGLLALTLGNMAVAVLW